MKRATKTTAKTAERVDPYQRVTEAILKQLEAGTVPWHQPWSAYRTAGKGGPVTGPRNAVTGHAYRGINFWLTAAQPYRDPRWLTFKQALDLGGCVRKGEHGTTVVLWKPTRYTVEDAKTGEEKTKQGLYLRTFTVFNVEQCDNLKLPELKQAAPLAPEAPPA